MASDITRGGLHEVLQVSMGWTDYHLHLFERNGQIFANPTNGFDARPAADDRNTRWTGFYATRRTPCATSTTSATAGCIKSPWRGSSPRNSRLQLPVCVKAKGACPAEDVGGLWGYYAILAAIRDPEHPDHKEYRDLFGPELDPDAFDIGKVNEVLQACFGRAA